MGKEMRGRRDWKEDERMTGWMLRDEETDGMGGLEKQKIKLWENK